MSVLAIHSPQSEPYASCLGAKRPKRLGKMDFVGGYQQALLDPVSAQCAGFITSEGDWNPPLE